MTARIYFKNMKEVEKVKGKHHYMNIKSKKKIYKCL